MFSYSVRPIQYIIRLNIINKWLYNTIKYNRLKKTICQSFLFLLPIVKNDFKIMEAVIVVVNVDSEMVVVIVVAKFITMYQYLTKVYYYYSLRLVQDLMSFK